jgi:hypothetical protein
MPPRAADDVLSTPGRPSAADVIGVDPGVVRDVLSSPEERDTPGFMPTAGMVEAKATMWQIFGSDPTLVPERITQTQAQLILGDKRMKRWCKIPGFWAWFLNKYEHAALADALYDRWIRMAFDRLPDMQDKDFIQLGKLLAEVAKKMPERWMKERVLDADVARMDDSRLMDLVLTTAKNLGWQVTIPEGAAGADLITAGDETDGRVDQPGTEEEADASRQRQEQPGEEADEEPSPAG